jgi:peptide/nickel transport system ATP-binding protein
MSTNTTPMLEVRNLKKHYPITRGVLGTEVGRTRAVDGISFTVRRGETFGIVGESGCGKTTAANSMLRLEEPTGGEILFEGEDITEYDSGELNQFRRNAQMMFQDPGSSLDPRMNVGTSIAEPLIVQGMTDRTRRRNIVGDLLERVGLSADDMKRFPHEFSGGQKQRIGLARALSVNPDLLVADEPVSALDVSVQSEILNLIDEFQTEFGLGVVVISHDLGVVREVCDRVGVMYLGEFVEVGPTGQIFTDPKHPYTKSLLSAIPTPDPANRGLGVELKGDVPDPSNPPSGCRFHTRCPEVIPPEEIDLPQETWRDVLHFRKQVLTGGIDLESIVDVGMLESDVEFDDQADPDTIDDERLKTWIRREYGLSERLADSTAESALEESLDALLGDDDPTEVLNEAFETVCERQKPELSGVGEDHTVACHLHDSQVSGGTGTGTDYGAGYTETPTD